MSSPTATVSYTVGVRTYVILGWIIVVFFTGCAIFWFQSGGPTVVFALFSALGLYLVIVPGRITLDACAIIHRNLFGTWRMPWTDIERIEIGGGTIVLHAGNNRRLVIYSADTWSGAEKPDAYALMVRKIQASGITPYPSNTAAFKWHKNTRVTAAAAQGGKAPRIPPSAPQTQRKALRSSALQNHIVMAGPDPAIHAMRATAFPAARGCPDQVRA